MLGWTKAKIIEEMSFKLSPEAEGKIGSQRTEGKEERIGEPLR